MLQDIFVLKYCRIKGNENAETVVVFASFYLSRFFHVVINALINIDLPNEFCNHKPHFLNPHTPVSWRKPQ